MKSKLNSRISIFLVLIMLLGILPMSVLAADNETVLTSINHSSAVSAVILTGSDSATLTVPYSYSGSTVDLSNGLDIFYNTSLYTSASASFPSGSVATVGGSSVSMTVIYQKTNDAVTYTTNYTINVIKASGTAPSFSGTIVKTVTLPTGLTFTDDDFTGKYTKNNGGELKSVVITGSNPTFGSLKFKGAAYVLGSSVNITDIENDKLTFTATSKGTVCYIVKAYALGTETPIGSVTLTITVNVSDSAGTIAYTTNKNKSVTLKSTDFSGAFSKATGSTLSYVKFTLPSSAYGKLYYGYVSPTDYDSLVSADTEYNKSVSPDLSHVTFVPYADYTGTVTISYTGYDADGTAFSGKLQITVKNAANETITYEAANDAPVSFKASDFNEVCEKVTGEDLSYVKFILPSSTYGKLYYDYVSSSDYDSLVSADTKYNKSTSLDISHVDFVPVSGNTRDVTISYTGYNTLGVSFTGTIKITFKEDGCHFTDVDKNLNWALKAIEYLFMKNVIMGEKPGYYNPHSCIKRGDFIVMLCRAFDLKADANGNFSDVEQGSYYYGAIAKAKSLKIVKGSNGRFNPKEALSREDAMVLIFRALAASNISLPDGSQSDLQSFIDSGNISDYAAPAAKALIKANIIQGCDKKINPKGSVSRAEMAVILYRILSK